MQDLQAQCLKMIRYLLKVSAACQKVCIMNYMHFGMNFLGIDR